jgi:colicin import membrane protein
VLTALIHLLLLALLVIGIRWQTQAPEPVIAELWSPTVTPPLPLPPAPTKPEPRPEPRGEPKPEPRPEPKPAPAEPSVEKPDIALEQERQRKERERKQREETERRERAEKEKADREKAEKERAEKAEKEKARKEAAEAKAKDDALRRELARENEERIRRELAGVATDSPKPAGAPNVGTNTNLAGDPGARAGYIDKIRAKVKGNVVLPQDLPGNPEAIFDVVQLPTGEVLSAKLRKSSGSKAYDEAVERAILKSSPLPRPDRPELFERNLVLRFRPQE